MIVGGLLHKIKGWFIFVLLFLLVIVSKGWCENRPDTDDKVANAKICSANEKERATALQKIQNSKGYFFKYELWGSPEKYIWKEICQGNVVSLKQGQLWQDVKCEESERQAVQSNFLNTLLLDPTLKSNISHKGVQIKCAKFEDDLDLSGISISFPLEISESTFKKKVNLSWLKSDAKIIFFHSNFHEGINLTNIEVKNDLSLAESLIFESLESEESKKYKDSGLFGAKIGDELHLEGAYFEGRLDMRRAKVAKCIYADQLIFYKIFMNDAEVGVFVNFKNNNSRRIKSVSGGWGELVLNNIRIGQDLNMEYGLFNEVSLFNAEIGNNLNLYQSNFFGILKMRKIRVGGDLNVRENVFSDNSNIRLMQSKINNLNINDSINKLNFNDSINLPSVFLDSGTISGNLKLPKPPEDIGRGKPNLWKDGAKLSLRDLEIKDLYESEYSWPPVIDLFGFRYKRIYGYELKGAFEFYKREDSWIKEWFKKREQKICDLKGNKKNSCEQDEFSLQPYFQMASVLEEAGLKGRANDIRYLGKQEERKRTNDPISFLWLSFMEFFIGYGYDNWRVGMAFLGLLLVGMKMFKMSVLSSPTKVDVRCFEFSLDLLLPIIELNKENHDRALQSLSKRYRYYFYFHKIMGHVLATFLFAGLSGIGK